MFTLEAAALYCNVHFVIIDGYSRMAKKLKSCHGACDVKVGTLGRLDNVSISLCFIFLERKRAEIRSEWSVLMTMV